jgi:hypothetical protein
MDLYAITLLLLLTPFALATVGGICFIWLHFRKQSAHINNIRFRFGADSNGNYELFYDDKSGNSFTPEPGNPSQFAPQIFLNGGSNSSARATRSPIKVNDSFWQVTELPGESKEISEPVRERSPHELTVEPQIYNQLLAAKRAGAPKGNSITRITGATKGGGSHYKSMCEIWDSLS